MSGMRKDMFAFAAVLVIAFGSAACSSSGDEDTGESGTASEVEPAAEAPAPEHDETAEVEQPGEEGEEGGVYIQSGDTWDATRRGARLVLAYDGAADAFKGTVYNTTESTLCAVRVEVHLGGGPELGPTEKNDVPAGQSTEIVLPAGGETVSTWTAHPEVSSCSGESREGGEHGEGGEDREGGEHGGETGHDEGGEG